MNADLDVGAALARADPCPQWLFDAWRDCLGVSVPAADVLDLLEESEGAGGRRRLTFGSDDVFVVVEVVRRHGGLMTVAGMVQPALPGRALLRSLGREAAMGMRNGVIARHSVPRAPFSLALELLDGRRLHTDWVLP